MSWGIAKTASEIEKIKSESANYLNVLKSCRFIDLDTYNYAFDFYTDLLMKAYEQGRKDAQPEPCEDAVSRKSVEDVLHGYFDGMLETDTCSPKDIYGLIELLPSVTPKRKTGKWKKIRRWGRCYSCDQCGNILDFNGVNAGRGDTNFCPNCGADMRGNTDDVN